MITIVCPDRDIEKKALALLVVRFSGRVLKNGVHHVSEEALETLASNKIPFTEIQKADYSLKDHLLNMPELPPECIPVRQPDESREIEL